jgi:negative regulator of sigma E activity
MRAARRQRVRIRAGQEPLPGGPPWWGMPAVLGAIASVSAAVAFVVR